MKIYPDPELPDIEVEWYEGDCFDETGNVVLTLAGVDDTAVKQELSVSCTAMKTTIKDVPRQRYTLDASLVDATGETYSRSPPMELDLRNGIDETAYLYFGGFNNFSVGWQFEGGATCSSAQVTFIDVRLSLPDDTQVFGSGAPCQAMFLYANAPEGVYNVDVFAVDNNGSTVASAPRIEGVELTFDRVTDLGIVTLAPCGDQCP